MNQRNDTSSSSTMQPTRSTYSNHNTTPPRQQRQQQQQQQPPPDGSESPLTPSRYYTRYEDASPSSQSPSAVGSGSGSGSRDVEPSGIGLGSPRSGLGTRRRPPIPLELSPGRGGIGVGRVAVEREHEVYHRRVDTDSSAMPFPSAPTNGISISSPRSSHSAYSNLHPLPPTRPSSNQTSNLPTSPSTQLSSASASASHSNIKTSISTSSSSSSLALPPIPRGLSQSAAATRSATERGTGNRLGVVRGSNGLEDVEGRISLDSYYTRASPQRETHESLSPQTPPNVISAHQRYPSTPGPIDPMSLDRRALIGVGELSTPRWVSPNADERHHGHNRRAQSISQAMSTENSYESFVGMRGQGTPLGSRVISGPRARVPSGSKPMQQEVPGRREGTRLGSTGNQEVKVPELPPLPSMGDFSPFRSTFADRMEPETPVSPTSPASNRSRFRTASASNFTSSRRYSPKVQADLLALQDKERDDQTKQALARASFQEQQQERQRQISSATVSGLPRSMQDPAQKTSTPSRTPRRSGASDDRLVEGLPRPLQSKRSSELDSRKTPPSASKRGSSIPNSPYAGEIPSAHSIIRHFGSTRDFSHLPPSPSTASISKFMLKEPSSVQSFSPADSPHDGPVQDSPYSGNSTAFGQSSQPSPATPKVSRTTYSTLDKETAEAIRKLDGLGKTPVKHRPEEDGPRKLRKAASTNSVGKEATDKRSEMPPPMPLRSGNDASQVSRGHHQSWQPSDNSRDADIDAQNRGSSSSTSAGTSTSATSGASTAPTSAHPSTGGFGCDAERSPSSPHGRRTSNGSDMPGSDGVNSDSDGMGNVPPVPPLPKDFQSMRPGSIPKSHSTASVTLPRAAAYVPIKDEQSLPPLLISDTSRLPNSISSPVLGSEEYHYSPMLPSAASSSYLSTYVESSTAGPPKAQRMSKKWSFSSALGLNSFGNKDKSDGRPAVAVTPTSPSVNVDDYFSSFSDTKNPGSVPWSSRNDGHPLHGLTLPESHARLQDGRNSSSGSSTGTAHALQRKTTNTADSAPPPSSSSTKRIPSSIPFFRRSSSSSISTQATQSTGKAMGVLESRDKAPPSRIPASSLTSRKSVLGIGIPALLKGSSSKRNLAAIRAGAVEEAPRTQLQPEPASEDRKSGLGWQNRKRGKTLSNAVDSSPKIAKALPPIHMKELSTPTLERVSSLSGRSSAGDSTVRLRSSSSSNVLAETAGERQGGMVRSATHAALQSAKTNLSTITGSPSTTIQAGGITSSSSALSSSGLRNAIAATPTKIPRIASRSKMSEPNVSVVGSMGPPAHPYTISGTRLSVPVVVGGRTDSIPGAGNRRLMSEARPIVNEFGMIASDSSRQLQDSRRSTREPNSEMPRVEDSPSTVGGVSRVTPGLRKVSAPAAAGARRALPVPPASSNSLAVTPQPDRLQRNLPLSPDSHRAQGPTSAQPPLSTSKLPAVSRLALPAHTRLTGSSSQPMFPSSRPNSIRQSISSRSQSPAGQYDDDRLPADEEMAAFYKRQKAKRTIKDTPADEIDHLLCFPDPGEPLPEMTPHAFIKANFENLSRYERGEIVDFKEIFYSGTRHTKNAATPEVTANNHGYDDERGDYLIIPGDHLAYRYEIEGVLGKGSFGQVLQCRDHKTGQYVAIKIIRNKKRFHCQAQVEVKILQNLVAWDPEDKHHLIKITDNFLFRGHLCIVTELLSINLYELIKANSFVGFSTTVIRRFTHQLLSSLDLMRRKRIIHCDLKPENILLCHPGKSRIKVIDFGSSCFENEKVYTYIQSRFYRSPEIILGCNYHMAIDMWSLGCILAELYTGFPIFPGENEQEQLSCIMEVLGVPDRVFVQKSSRSKLFFDSTGEPRVHINSKGKRRRPGTKTLSQVLKCDDPQFVDFISKCLIWDPERRLKPATALKHPWITAARRNLVASPTPGSRLSGGVASSPIGNRTRGIHQDILKERISGPSPLVARKSGQVTETPHKTRIGQYNSTRSVAA